MTAYNKKKLGLVIWIIVMIFVAIYDVIFISPWLGLAWVFLAGADAKELYDVIKEGPIKSSPWTEEDCVCGEINARHCSVHNEVNNE